MLARRRGSLLLYLSEMRSRVLSSVAVFLLACVVLLPFRNPLYNLVSQPIRAVLPAHNMVTIDVTAGLFVPMKVCAFLALLLTMPYILYQLWCFLMPALYRRERWLLAGVSALSYFFFCSGLLFFYKLVLPILIHSIHHTLPEHVFMLTDMDRYLSFLMTMLLTFGIVFEVPLVVFGALWTGIVTTEHLRAVRPYVIVGCFVLGAIVAPPDVLSQCLIAIPLWLLYEWGWLMYSAFVTMMRWVWK